jgi:hypothetical protein
MLSAFKYNDISDSIKRQAPHRSIGFGKPLPDVPRGTLSLGETRKRAFVGMAKMGWTQCPTYNLPIIDSVTEHFDGPLTTAAIQATFANTINPLGANAQTPPPGCSQVDTTFAEPGKFQTFAFVCAIQFRIDVEPVTFAAKVNSMILPTAALAKPVSPDAFVTGINGAGIGDLATAGPLGLTAAQGTAVGNFLPGILDWSGWFEQAAFYMSRGYNLFWQAGHNQSLMNDSLRYTAYVPTNAQDGSASSSEQAIAFYIRRTNAYYKALSPATTRIIASIDRVRLGSEQLGGTAGLSVFRPSRAYETVGATYGGIGIRQILKGNNEFRRLTSPAMFWPGMPIGLRAQVSSSDDQGLMQQYLDVAFAGGPTGLPASGVGTIPASFTDDPLITSGSSIAGTAAVTGVEPSFDATSVANGLQLPAQRDYYQGGSFKITVAFKGFELTPDQAEMWNQDPSIKAAVQSECGCSMVFPGT